MGSSGGSANPMFLSQGGTPMPNIPIAGQAGELKPQERGSYQEFLPEIAPAGQPGYQILPVGGGRNPSATGLTAEMFKYRSPSGVLTPSAAAAGGGGGGGGGSGSDIDTMRQQIATLQAQAGNGQFGAARGGSQGSGMFNQQGSTSYPQNWFNSNVPNATS
jgi:hypothetical protein